MSQKIIRIGSSLGITVPKRLLKKIHAKIGDEIELNYNSRREVIEFTLVKPSGDQPNSIYAEIKQLIEENKEEFEKLDA